MQNNNNFEKINFKSLIESNAYDRIEDRMDILDVFLATEEHITLEQLFQILEKKGYKYKPEFVRQCMNRMVDLGFAQKKHFEGKSVLYEHHHLGAHHDHLICTKCGKISEFSNENMERLQKRIALEQGFHVLQHKMEIYGICSECLNQRQRLIPLAITKTGERVIIREILGCNKAKARIISMGFKPGDQLEIINNTGQKRLILGHDFTRLAIGRGVAKNIMVSVAKDDMK